MITNNEAFAQKSPTAPEKKYQVGLNHKIIGKTSPQNLSYAGAWEAREVTIEELADHIGKGHPVMPALLDGNGKRWQTNANQAEMLAIDIDGGFSIEQAENHAFVISCANLGIETTSSTPEHNKFRLFFASQEVITYDKKGRTVLVDRHIWERVDQRGASDCTQPTSPNTSIRKGFGSIRDGRGVDERGEQGEDLGREGAVDRRHRGSGGRGGEIRDSKLTFAISPGTFKTIYVTSEEKAKGERFREFNPWQVIRICNRYLAHVIGHADPACKDASRFFFGSLGRIAFILNPDAKLPADFIDQAMAWDAELERLAAIEQAKRAEYLATLDVSDQAEIARQALEFIPPYSPGNGTYNDLIVMMAGVVNDLGSDGEALLEAWGGFGRETLKKAQGLARNPTRKSTLGSLFYLAKQEGFKFPTRQSTPKTPKADRVKIFGEVRKAIALCLGELDRLAGLPAKINMPVIGVNLSDPLVGDVLKRIKEAGLVRKGAIVILPNPGEVGDRVRMDWYREFVNKAIGQGYKVNVGWWNQEEPEALGVDQLDSMPHCYEAIKWLNQMVLFDAANHLLAENKIKQVDQVVCTRNLQDDLTDFPQFGQLVLDSAAGTGKSKFVAKNTQGMSALAISHREVLGKKNAADFRMTFRNTAYFNPKTQTYHDVIVGEDGSQKKGPIAKRLSTVNVSLPRINLRNQFPRGLDVLILDEVVPMLDAAMLGDLSKETRLAEWATIEQAIKMARWIIIADGDITQRALDVIADIRGEDDSVYVVKNNYVPDEKTIKVLMPEKGGSNAASAYALQIVKPEDHLLFMSDSASIAEGLAQTLEARGQRCFVITGAAKDNFTLLERHAYNLICEGKAEEALELVGCQHLLSSPCIEQGVNFESDYFTKVFSVNGGSSLLPQGVRQQTWRARRNPEIYFYAKEKSNVRFRFGDEVDPDVLKERIHRIEKFEDRQIYGFDVEQSRNEMFQRLEHHSIVRSAEQNAWMPNFRQNCIALFKDWGAKIEYVSISADGQEVKEAIEDWKEHTRQTIVDAPMLGAGKAKEIKERWNHEDTTPEERNGAKRFKVCDFYAIEPETLDTELLAWDGDGIKRQKAIKRLETILAPDGEAMAISWDSRNSNGLMTDRSRYCQQRAALIGVGIMELMQVALVTPEGLTNTHPTVLAVAETAIKHAPKLHAAGLGRYSAKMQPMQVAKKLLSFIAINLKGERVRVLGKLVYHHKWDAEQNDMTLATIDRRYAARQKNRGHEYTLVRGWDLIHRFIKENLTKPTDHPFYNSRISTLYAVPRDQAWLEAKNRVEQLTLNDEDKTEVTIEYLEEHFKIPIA